MWVSQRPVLLNQESQPGKEEGCILSPQVLSYLQLQWQFKERTGGSSFLPGRTSYLCGASSSKSMNSTTPAEPCSSAGPFCARGPVCSTHVKPGLPCLPGYDSPLYVTYVFNRHILKSLAQAVNRTANRTVPCREVMSLETMVGEGLGDGDSLVLAPVPPVGLSVPGTRPGWNRGSSEKGPGGRDSVRRVKCGCPPLPALQRKVPAGRGTGTGLRRSAVGTALARGIWSPAFLNPALPLARWVTLSSSLDLSEAQHRGSQGG